MLALYGEKCSFYPRNMIKSEDVNQCLEHTGKLAIAGIALATSFSADFNQPIVTIMEILSLPYPTTLHQKVSSDQ